MSNKKINYYYSLIILLIIIIIVSSAIFLKVKSNNYNNQTQFENSEKIRMAEYERNIKMKRDSNELFSENMQLEDLNIYTQDNELIKLKSQINEPKLVYRFTNHSCNTCVENDIRILKTLADSIGLDRIIIISKFDNIKFLKIYVLNENLPFVCYNFNDILNLPIEKNSINESPCFFVLDNELKVDFAYTSIPSHTYNSLYFKRIRKFFKQ